MNKSTVILFSCERRQTTKVSFPSIAESQNSSALSRSTR